MGENRFGQYELIELLGRGGMGEVFRAFDTATKRTVAIKVLPPHLAGDPGFVARFQREAELAASLSDPHVIPIHTYGEIDGRLFVDMRLIEGRDLGTVISEGPLAAARAVGIVEQVAKALHAAHRAGLVHRDVKPTNVLLDADDFAYLIDFGIARSVDQTRLTNTNSTIGTWAYMSPERFSDRPVGAGADIYALACVLYECLTGRVPFPGTTLESQVAAHLTTPPPRPSRRFGVPPAMDAVIAHGMAKDPDDRFQTTTELARAARAALAVPRPAPPTPAQPLADTPPAPPISPRPPEAPRATVPTQPAQHRGPRPPPSFLPPPGLSEAAGPPPADTASSPT